MNDLVEPRGPGAIPEAQKISWSWSNHGKTKLVFFGEEYDKMVLSILKA